MNRPETVLKEQKIQQTIEVRNKLFETVKRFTIAAQGQERSYEDRNVYLHIDEPDGLLMREWLTAEQAIEIGNTLIAAGRQAFLDNMYNHQTNQIESQLDLYLREDRIKKVVLEMKDENPVNYGAGFKLFEITPVFEEGETPEYVADFSYEKVISFSPFEREYNTQLQLYGGPEMVEFIGYDHDYEVEIFQEQINELAKTDKQISVEEAAERVKKNRKEKTSHIHREQGKKSEKRS